MIRPFLRFGRWLTATLGTLSLLLGLALGPMRAQAAPSLDRSHPGSVHPESRTWQAADTESSTCGVDQTSEPAHSLNKEAVMRHILITGCESPSKILARIFDPLPVFSLPVLEPSDVSVLVREVKSGLAIRPTALGPSITRRTWRGGVGFTP